MKSEYTANRQLAQNARRDAMMSGTYFQHMTVTGGRDGFRSLKKAFRAFGQSVLVVANAVGVDPYNDNRGTLVVRS